MAKFPEPPDPLVTPPVIMMLPESTVLFRIYSMGCRYPIAWNEFRHYGPTHSRFDHHLDPESVQDRGILYAATQPTTCLAEVFQATRVIDRAGNAPWLVGFDCIRPLALLDLTGVWPTRVGASMAINSGPRPRARRWSRAIYAAFPTLDGLYYASSMHQNRVAVALYERAKDGLPSSPSFHRALVDPSIERRLDAAAVALGYRLV